MVVSSRCCFVNDLREASRHVEKKSVTKPSELLTNLSDQGTFNMLTLMNTSIISRRMILLWRIRMAQCRRAHCGCVCHPVERDAWLIISLDMYLSCRCNGSYHSGCRQEHTPGNEREHKLLSCRILDWQKAPEVSLPPTREMLYRFAHCLGYT